jgi:hypothetical protein
VRELTIQGGDRTTRKNGVVRRSAVVAVMAERL